jgi:hypothetical protein
MTTSWQERLNEACSTEDVLRVVNEFLSMWSAGEREALSETWPGRIDNVQHLTASAYRFACQLTGTAKTDPELHRLSTFLTKASLRFFEIAERSAAVPHGSAPPRRPRSGGSQGS